MIIGAQHELRDAPVSGVYLMEDWCTPAEEEYLVDRVYKQAGGRWTQLSGRRLQNWGGTVHEKGMIPQKSEYEPSGGVRCWPPGGR